MQDNNDIKAEEVLNDDEMDTVAGGMNHEGIEGSQKPRVDTTDEENIYEILHTLDSGMKRMDTKAQFFYQNPNNLP